SAGTAQCHVFFIAFSLISSFLPVCFNPVRFPGTERLQPVCLAQFLFHHIRPVFPVPVLGVKTAGGKVLLTAQVYMGGSFPLLPQVLLSCPEETCADALSFPGSLYIEPVQPRLSGTGDGAIADTANHPVVC